jgi:hypothetical protein
MAPTLPCGAFAPNSLASSATPSLDTLSRQHPLPADPHLAFAEEGHQYTAWGQRVQRSTTKLIAECFGAFDGAGCVETYYEAWKANPKSEYHARIHAALDAGASEEEAKASILAMWEQWRDLGTALHAHCELDLNGVAPALDPALAPEVAQFEQFKASAFVAERGLRPYRTELCVAYRAADGVVVCAGRVDALFVDAEGSFYLLDFKRSKRKLGGGQRGFQGAMGTGVASHLAETDFHKYSLQLACYALMLEQTHGIAVDERCYLLRMHPSLSTYELVQGRDLRKEALALLESEHQRLLEELKKKSNEKSGHNFFSDSSIKLFSSSDKKRSGVVG